MPPPRVPTNLHLSEDGDAAHPAAKPSGQEAAPRPRQAAAVSDRRLPPPQAERRVDAVSLNDAVDHLLRPKAAVATLSSSRKLGNVSPVIPALALHPQLRPEAPTIGPRRARDLSDRPLICSATRTLRDGRVQMAVGGASHSVYLFDPRSSAKERELYTRRSGHTDWVSSVDFMPDGKVVSGGMDGRVCVWTGMSAMELTPSPRISDQAASTIGSSAGFPVSRVRSLGEGNVVAASYYDGAVRILGISSPMVFSGPHKAPITDFILMPPSRLVSCGRDGSLGIWNVSKLALEESAKPHSCPFKAVALPGEEHLVFTASTLPDCTAKLYDLRTPSSPVFSMPSPIPGGVTAIATGWDNRTVLLGSSSGNIASLDLRGPMSSSHQSSSARIISSPHAGAPVSTLALHAGRRVVSAGWDGQVCISDGVVGGLEVRLAGIPRHGALRIMEEGGGWVHTGGNSGMLASFEIGAGLK